MKKRLLSLFLFILPFIFPSSISAQVVINEFSSDSNPEWVELYNTSSSTIDLTGWGLQDEAQPIKLLTGSISANGYFVFENSTGWLNSSGSETIYLKDSGGVTIDSVHYGSGGVVGIPDSDKSASRIPNGGLSWQNNSVWTKGSVNPNPTPTASPTPTPTSSSTPTQTPTSTPSSTKSPTPVATKTSTPKPSTTPTSTPTESPEVLGLNTKSNGPTATPDVLVEGDNKKKFPVIPVALILSGVLIIALPILQLMNARKNQPET